MRRRCLLTLYMWFEELVALVPLPRVHLVRYEGCLAPHCQLRATIILTPCQQGVEGHKASLDTPRWTWARLLKRVFALDLATCPRCQHGTLRIISAITHAKVIRHILRRLKRAPDPPPTAPARCSQATFMWLLPEPPPLLPCSGCTGDRQRHVRSA